MLNIDFKFSITPQEIDLDLGEIVPITETVEPEPTPTPGPTETDHSKLTNRDLPDQHPIGAITDLGGKLDDLNTGVSTANTKVAELQNTMSGVDGEIDSLSSSVSKKLDTKSTITNTEILEILGG